MLHQQSNHKRSLSFNHHLSYNQYSSPILAGTNTLTAQKQPTESAQQAQLREQQAYNAKINSKGIANHTELSWSVLSWLKIDFFCIIANWSISNLRPAPPLRPAIINTNSTSNAVLTSSKKSQPTYEEDALVLRVIEAYCVAYQNPTRNALHSGSSLSIHCSLAAFLRTLVISIVSFGKVPFFRLLKLSFS